MKALSMKRTSVSALACVLAITAAIGVGVAQANAADVEADDTITLEERVQGNAKDDGVNIEMDNQIEEPEGNLSEQTDEPINAETNVSAASEITDDGIEKPADDAEVNAAVADESIEEEASDNEVELVAAGEDEEPAKKSSGKTKAKASAFASNAIEDVESEYIEAEEWAAEDLDEADAEASSSVSRYLDEDEPAENIVELRGE